MIDENQILCDEIDTLNTIIDTRDKDISDMFYAVFSVCSLGHMRALRDNHSGLWKHFVRQINKINEEKE